MRWLLVLVGAVGVLAVAAWFVRRGEPLAPTVEVEALASTEESGALEMVLPEVVGADSNRTAQAGREALERVGDRASTSDPARTIRGQVVDARTGLPFPSDLGLGLLVDSEAPGRPFLSGIFGKRGFQLGEEASFELTSREPDTLTASLVFWSSGQRVEPARAAHRYADERQPDGSWRVAIPVAWFARIVLEPEPGELEFVDIELVEGRDGQEELRRDGIVGMDPPCLLFVGEPTAGAKASRRRVEVMTKEVDGTRFVGGVDVSLADGVQMHPIRVALFLTASVIGRVVDEKGAPRPGWTTVRLLPNDPALRLREEEFPHTLVGSRDEEVVRGDDEFRFIGQLPGTYRLVLSAPLVSARVHEVRLGRGSNDLGDLVLPGESRVGVVSGKLEKVDGVIPRSLLVLRDLRTGRELQEYSDTRGGFRFSDVPIGRYELSAIQRDGVRYPASPWTIEAPSSDLVLTGEKIPGRLGVPLLRDARTKVEIDPDKILVKRDGHWVWVTGFPSAEDESLVASARGYRPVVARPPVIDGARGRLRREIELEPGYGRLVYCLDDAGQALAGARISADGRLVGYSDACGLVVIALESEPSAWEYKAAGYKVAVVEPEVVLFVRE